MAYGKIKADTLVYDNSGSDVEVTLASLGNKANLASPTFTGTVTIPTPAANDNTTKAASTAYVQTELGDYAALAGATFTGNVVMSANLTVQGTTTTISSTTIEVADKNLELGKVSTPTDTTADGGGITLKGASDKTFNWVDATDAWTSSEHIHLGDSKKFLAGTGSDLSIYHDGTNTHIDNNTGHLFIRNNVDDDDGGNIYIQGKSQENSIVCNDDGSVDLYFDTHKSFDTDANGIRVFGPEGGSAFIHLYADEGDDNADKWWLKADQDGTGFYLQNYVSGSTENCIRAVGNGSVILFHDNTNRIETTAAGVTVNGLVTDTKGELRNIPKLIKSSAHTLVATDAGQTIYTSSGGVTINSSVLSAGDAVTIINNSGSDQTITQGSGVTLYNTADAATGNRTLAGRGMATVWFADNATVYISGAGLS